MLHICDMYVNIIIVVGRHLGVIFFSVSVIENNFIANNVLPLTNIALCSVYAFSCPFILGQQPLATLSAAANYATPLATTCYRAEGKGTFPLPATSLW